MVIPGLRSNHCDALNINAPPVYPLPRCEGTLIWNELPELNVVFTVDTVLVIVSSVNVKLPPLTIIPPGVIPLLILIVLVFGSYQSLLDSPIRVWPSPKLRLLVKKSCVYVIDLSPQKVRLHPLHE